MMAAINASYGLHNFGNILILKRFLDPEINSGWQSQGTEAREQDMFDSNKSLLIKTTTPAIVIPNFRDLKRFASEFEKNNNTNK